MRIALLGDIALIGKYGLANASFENIECLRESVKDCDFVIANLESPLTSINTTKENKGVYLRSNPDNVALLKYIGVTHVTLANNHTFDYGVVGAEETIKVLGDNGIKYVGLNNGPEVLQCGNDKAMLEGFCCYSANATHYAESGFGVNVLTPDRLKDFLASACEKDYLPIASVHFGVEGLHYPAVEHIRLFEDMAARYSYVLHGNHPHAVQGIRRSNESLLCYALGNTCFDDCFVTSIGRPCIQTEEEHKSAIVKIEIKDFWIYDYQTIGLSDSADVGIRPDASVEKSLQEYSRVLQQPLSAINPMRKAEEEKQLLERPNRSASFYLQRLNRKYIGAFLAGRNHAKEYQNVMSKYLGEVNE